MTPSYTFLQKLLIPILVSSLTFFVGRIFSEKEYEKKLNNIEATLERMDERQANFMGYVEDYKAREREKDAKMDERIEQVNKEVNRIYVEYLPYLKFDFRKK